MADARRVNGRATEAEPDNRPDRLRAVFFMPVRLISTRITPLGTCSFFTKSNGIHHSSHAIYKVIRGCGALMESGFPHREAVVGSKASQ